MGFKLLSAKLFRISLQNQHKRRTKSIKSRKKESYRKKEWRKVKDLKPLFRFFFLNPLHLIFIFSHTTPPTPLHSKGFPFLTVLRSDTTLTLVHPPRHTLTQWVKSCLVSPKFLVSAGLLKLMQLYHFMPLYFKPGNIYLFKVSNKNTWTKTCFRKNTLLL